MYIHMCVRACINEYVRSATEEEEKDEDEVGKEDEEVRKSEEEEEVSFKSAIHLVHRRRESGVIRERERERKRVVSLIPIHVYAHTYETLRATRSRGSPVLVSDDQCVRSSSLNVRDTLVAIKIGRYVRSFCEFLASILFGDVVGARRRSHASPSVIVN